ncbi:phage holin family protein [Roseiconus lacunae]|uniref:Phage holin family protein n=1 Tax=Roseiconus lacunae TaxID=2605694 RepID=A0ABT7PD22_9BACT|nr:phage holin family protein [Roseiconus lacunae]MDM4014397.1 phage holin family protein [Roseiconus lacunae]
MSEHTSPSPMRVVLRDIIDLMELQWQLLSVDSQEARRKLTKAMIAGVSAVTLAGSALTVLLVGVGFLIRDLTPLGTGAAIIVTSVTAFVVVVVLLWLAAGAATKASQAMTESKSEFVESLKWLKATLVTPRSSARNQIRAESFGPYSSGHSPEMKEMNDHMYRSQVSQSN